MLKIKIITPVFLLCSLLLPMFLFAGCSSPAVDNYTVNVTFVYNNDVKNKTVSIKSGDTVSVPSDPIKPYYIFLAWCTDEQLYAKYDFSQPVTKDLTLYAAYQLDAATITNEISGNTIQGLVQIHNKSYNKSSGKETSSHTYHGSGFCFRIQNGFYYILTNSHVVTKDTSYKYQEITIEDYVGNIYEGALYHDPARDDDAIDPSYDLACLYFKSDSTDVKALKFASNPNISEDVVALGSPKKQSNCITFGKVKAYTTFTAKDPNSSSNVRFEVIKHGAWIDNGSSGGPLLNSELQVVGVNFGSSENSTIRSGNSFAIPASKVNEFLKKYVYA